MMTDDRLAYVDAAVKLYQDKLVAFAPEWSAAWYQSMSAPIPVDTDGKELDQVESKFCKKQKYSHMHFQHGEL